VIWVVIVILNVVVVPHWPAAGVNVYTDVPTVVVLMVAGFQVPVIPLVDVNGNAGATEFWHSGPMIANVGMIWLVIVTLNCTVVPHCPGSGVNV
jgi:hypothetical protein